MAPWRWCQSILTGDQARRAAIAFVDNAGVSIHYEFAGRGPDLVLMHGMGASVRDWYDAGYVDKLAGEFRLVLIDSRGFGASDKPHEVEAYGREQKVSDVTAVLDELGVERTYYWGYSMGASIGWAFGMLRPERLRGLVLGAYPVIPAELDAVDRARWESRAKLMRLGMDVYVAALEMDRGPMLVEEKARLLANDNEAYACQQLANLAWGATDDDIRRMTVPSLVYAGTDDARNHGPTKRSASLAPNATWLSLEGYTHASAFANSDNIVPHVRAFVAKVERAG